MLGAKGYTVLVEEDILHRPHLPNGCFDWHEHEDIDEFFLVIKGTGIVELEDGTTTEYKNEDIVYMPSNMKHKITAKEDSEFFFIRIND